MTFVFGFVFGRKWLTSFVFVSVSAENKITFSSPVSFSAENVYTGFGRSLVWCWLCYIASYHIVQYGAKTGQEYSVDFVVGGKNVI